MYLIAAINISRTILDFLDLFWFILDLFMINITYTW